MGSSTLTPDRALELEETRSLIVTDEKQEANGPEEFSIRIGDEEDEHPEVASIARDTGSKPTSGGRMTMWMIINTLATIGIVFINKRLFDDPSFRNAQLTFAAFHFTVTGTLLYVVSRPQFGMFQPRTAGIRDMIPLASAMCLNVVLPNLSLAFSSVTFYQIARISLTPTVALINFVFYNATIPRPAVYALVPVCIGVGMVSYYDSLPQPGSTVRQTSTLGVVFAFSGVLASSLYTVWIAVYHKKLQMNSMQLLFNQAPIGVVLMLYVIPFTDTFPEWSQVPMGKWTLILMSGFFACLINVSQFLIIAGAGPVSSTVVGHVKTCSIVAIGWFVGGKSVGDRSIFGILLAIGGIISYSIVMIKTRG
ncbi:MAG: hypothetical protein M1817_002391 [Caeruleum heppii]|nr:MAG: hypothetical protein M1817_002391 [Caeruleum heppii]